MAKKYLYIIPLFLLEVMIQLGFFWLAPMCECRWVVYFFLTIMTIAHLVITFVFMIKYGVRKYAATIVAGSFIQAIIMGAVILLLTVEASVRSALFLMLMLLALYAAVVAIFWISMGELGEDSNHTPHMGQNDSETDYEPYYDNNSVNGFSGRGSAGRTLPPIPVKH